MSDDHKVTKDVVQTLEDGRLGFASAAEKLVESGDTDLASTFRGFSEQRAMFATELREMAKAYGDDGDASSSVASALHRGWMSIKDAVSGSDPGGVLDVAEQGEQHAVREYEKALEADISAGLGEVLHRQLADVRAAYDSIRSLHNA